MKKIIIESYNDKNNCKVIKVSELHKKESSTILFKYKEENGSVKCL